MASASKLARSLTVGGSSTMRWASTFSWAWLRTIPHHTLSCSASEHGMGKKSASQVSSSWRSLRSWLLTKKDAPFPSFNPGVGMSVLPERRQVARLGIEQGTLAIPDGVDDDKVSCPVVEAHHILPSPGQQSIGRAQQPAVQVTDKQDTMGDCRKAPGQLFR